METLTESDKQRFWAKVNKDGPVPSHVPELGKCWIWTASLDRKGYGQFGVEINGKWVPRRAHRTSWFIQNGFIPPERFALHKCDNPLCVNPEHLFLGNQQDNMADKKRKGRNPTGDESTARKHIDKMVRGNGHPTSKITEVEAMIVKLLLNQGKSPKEIASKTRASVAMIHQIRYGFAWKHVGPKLDSSKFSDYRGRSRELQTALRVNTSCSQN